MIETLQNNIQVAKNPRDGLWDADGGRYRSLYRTAPGKCFQVVPIETLGCKYSR